MTGQLPSREHDELLKICGELHISEATAVKEALIIWICSHKNVLKPKKRQ